MEGLPPDPKDGDCTCMYDPDTGYFNPCCIRHEEEYMAFLVRQVPYDSEGA